MLPCFRKFKDERSQAVEFRFSKDRTEEEICILKNGGRILEQLITSFNGKCNPFRIFSKEELETATNNYHSSQILSKNFNHILYKGIHEDRRISIKRFTECSSPTHIGWCINEVAVASQMSKHKNILKFLGYCLETEIPTLVFEFAGNGNLSDCIFGDQLLPWETKLRIATEVADAIAYLHLGASKPIIHREINSTNIILDQHYVAKLFELSFSVPIPLGEDHVDAEVVGSVGFIAPESLATGRFTQKSDVYSFGAVLFEILTGKRAWNILHKVVEITGGGYNRKNSMLRTHSSDEIEKMAESQLKAYILEEGNQKQLTECTEIALQCLKMNSDDRPTMKEVAQALRLIKIL